MALTTFTQTITTGTNSVHEIESNGNVVDDSNEVIVNAAAADTIAGLRFTSVTIPQGSVIVRATINIVPNSASEDDAALTFYCEDADNAAVFNIGAATSDLSDRTWTTSHSFYGDLGLGTSAVDSTDFSGPLQEVVNRASWASGNAFVLIMDGRPNEGVELIFDPDNITLTVEYDTANPAPKSNMGITSVVSAAPTIDDTIQTITSEGFGTPQAVMVYGSNGLLAGTIVNNLMFSYGGYARETSWHNVVRGEHGAAATAARKRGVVGEQVQFTDISSDVTDGRAHVSFVEDGIRLYWREAPSAANLITVVMFRGFADAAAGEASILGGGIGTTTDIDMGLDPDIAYFGHINGQGLNTATGSAQPSMGIVTRESGSPVQAGMGIYVRTGEDPSINSGVVHNTSGVITSHDNSNIIRDASATFISNGIRATRQDGNAGNSTVGWLALKLPAGGQVALDIVDTPTSEGVQSYTAPNFYPLAVMCLGHWQTDADAAVDTGFAAWGVGIFTNDSEHSVTVSEQHNQATTVSKSLVAATGLSVLDEDGTIGYQASKDKFTSTGIDLNFTSVDGTARKVIMLVIGEPPSAARGDSSGLSALSLAALPGPKYVDSIKSPPDIPEPEDVIGSAGGGSPRPRTQQFPEVAITRRFRVPVTFPLNSEITVSVSESQHSKSDALFLPPLPTLSLDIRDIVTMKATLNASVLIRQETSCQDYKRSSIPIAMSLADRRTDSRLERRLREFEDEMRDNQTASQDLENRKREAESLLELNE